MRFKNYTETFSKALNDVQEYSNIKSFYIREDYNKYPDNFIRVEVIYPVEFTIEAVQDPSVSIRENDFFYIANRSHNLAVYTWEDWEEKCDPMFVIEGITLSKLRRDFTMLQAVVFCVDDYVKEVR